MTPLPEAAALVGFDDAVLYQEFTVLRGKTFKRAIKLYQDDSNTLPLDFSNLTFRLVIDGYMVLTVEDGLELTSNSDVLVTLNPTRTEEAPEERHHYFLEVEETTENNTAAVHGVLTFVQP